ncbi:Hypothetical protein, putative [Bodo saltans]|uniref:Uncharacterized protein n=1 Tax=Bodo saltans TaxID=75058 RepID=A0A0S4JFD3_BODSA|nr:Hypothetical protein, putative [Bodo saltans]|eukprot:CUG87858.1 Hypothetical protein, putative [Bodo saltans]
MSDHDHDEVPPAVEIEEGGPSHEEAAPDALDTTVEGDEAVAAAEAVGDHTTEGEQEPPTEQVTEVEDVADSSIAAETDNAAAEAADASVGAEQVATDAEQVPDEANDESHPVEEVAVEAVEEAAVEASVSVEEPVVDTCAEEAAPVEETAETNEGETAVLEAAPADDIEGDVDAAEVPGDAAEAEAEVDESIQETYEAAAPQPPKVYPRIVRPKKTAVKPVDPAAAVIAGSWTTTALSHDFTKTEVRTNGIDAAVKKGRVNIPNNEDSIQVKEMTGDTKGMQTLYTRMLTTKQWW